MPFHCISPNWLRNNWAKCASVERVGDITFYYRLTVRFNLSSFWPRTIKLGNIKDGKSKWNSAAKESAPALFGYPWIYFCFCCFVLFCEYTEFFCIFLQKNIILVAEPWTNVRSVIMFDYLIGQAFISFDIWLNTINLVYG